MSAGQQPALELAARDHHVAGRELDRVGAGVEHDGELAPGEGEQVGPGVEELDVLAGVARVLAAGGQRGR